MRTTESQLIGETDRWHTVYRRAKWTRKSLRSLSLKYSVKAFRLRGEGFNLVHGKKPARSKTQRANSASHSLSAISFLRAGTLFTCRALPDMS